MYNLFQYYNIKYYGINKNISRLLFSFIGCNCFLIKKSNMNTYLLMKLNKFITNNSNFMGKTLKKDILKNILLKIKTNSYQGFCFKNNLPVRGQHRRNKKKRSILNFFKK